MTKGPEERAMADWLLAFWLVLALIWDVVAYGFTAYAVFWRGASPWWFAITIWVGSSPSLFKALRKRYGVEKESQ